MSQPVISLIITVLNEAKTLPKLLLSIKNQTLLPIETVIVDGGSTDQTQKIIQEFSQKNPELKLKFSIVPGNRSLGRNYAIKLAKSDWLAITDAGCTLEPNWLAELNLTQKKLKAEVVAGYYRGLATTSFQTALVPYVLVMPDKLPKTETEIFLPATRSMLVTKKAWQLAGGFDEKLSDNEDYAFAHTLVKTGVKLAFCPTAIVNWQPPDNLAVAIKMFYRFAKGDATARIWRPKVAGIFGRYSMFFFGTSYLASIARFDWLVFFLSLGLFGYSAWAIGKNYRFVKTGWWWLPILQICSDLAVMAGSIVGWLKIG